MEKNVLYFGGFKLPDKNAAAHRVLTVSKLFNSLNFKVYLFGQQEDLQQEVREIQIKDHNNIKMFNTKYPSSIFEWISYVTSTKSIKQLCNCYNPEIIVFYNYPAIPQLRIRKFLKKRGVKVIADTTEWYIATDRNPFRRLVKLIDTELRMRFVNKYLDGNIVISKYLSSFYKKYHHTLLPPVIDTQENKWNKIKNSIIIQNSSLEFVYAGQLGGKKDNLIEIFDVLEKISKQNNFLFKFHLIGIDKKDYQEKINDKIYPFLIFHGRLSHEETLKIVSKSDFVVFHRDNNKVNLAGFPTKFVEAYECGTPVITNLSSNLSDYLKDDKNGYILDSNMEQKFKEIILKGTSNSYVMKNNLKQANIFDYRNFLLEFEKFIQNL